MRVLHVLNHISGQGNGIVNAALDLVAAQVEAGHTVVVASAGGEYEELLRQMGVRHIRLPQERTVRGMAKALGGLRQAVLAVRPQVVHAHMVTGLLLARFWRPMLRFALVAQVHNVHQGESRLMRLADRVVVVSEAVGRSMEAEGMAHAKLRVVLNRPLGSPRAAEAMGPETLLEGVPVLTVAGMYERKGISDLIAAFARVAEEVPEAQLYLVGDGPDRARFEAQARATGCAQRIHFGGYTAYPLSWMRAAEVFVLASRRESFGLVLVEARAMGCAVIASDADGMPEALDGGAAGMLYRAGDVDELAGALRLMLGHTAVREQWKARAQAGLDRWQYGGLAAEMDAVYRELVRD